MYYDKPYKIVCEHTCEHKPYLYLLRIIGFLLGGLVFGYFLQSLGSVCSMYNVFRF